MTQSLDASEPVDGDPPRTYTFFTWLGGADQAALAMAPDERHKFTGIGGVVLTTAVLAATSMTFALVTAARVPVYFALPVGLAWGLAIMNLDRWLVTAIQRQPRWYQNLMLTLPRLLLAVIIGLVISTPMVLWIFQHEINSELDTIHQQKRTAFEQQLASDKEIARIPDDQKQITTLQAIIDGTDPSVVDPTAAIKTLTAQKQTAFDTWQKWLNQSDCERDGASGCGGSGLQGKGPNWRDDQARAAQYKTLYDETSAALTAAQGDQGTAVGQAQATAKDNLATVNQDLASLLAQKKALIAQNDADLANDRGLLARLDALTKLTADNPTLRDADILVGLLIILLETMPVFAKFLMSLGEESVYDKAKKITDQARLDEIGDTVALVGEKRRAFQQVVRGRITQDAEEEVNRRTRRTVPIPFQRLDEGEGDVFTNSTIGSEAFYGLEEPTVPQPASAPAPRRRWFG